MRLKSQVWILDNITQFLYLVYFPVFWALRLCTSRNTRTSSLCLGCSIRLLILNRLHVRICSRHLFAAFGVPAVLLIHPFGWPRGRTTVSGGFDSAKNRDPSLQPLERSRRGWRQLFFDGSGIFLGFPL